MKEKNRREAMKDIGRYSMLGTMGLSTAFFLNKEARLKAQGICILPEVCLSCNEFPKECELDKADKTRKLYGINPGEERKLTKRTS